MCKGGGFVKMLLKYLLILRITDFITKKGFILLLIVFLVGCNSEDAVPYIEQGFTGEIGSIEGVVQREERIQNRQLVAAEDIVLVTYEVKPQFRVQKQRVERELKEQLEKAYPSLQFVVSGDFKLHYEAQQLAKKKENDSSEEEVDKEADKETQNKIKKEIEQLKELAEEET